MVIVGWSIWHARESQKQEAEGSLQKDFTAAWTWSEGELVGGASAARWSFRWDGHLKRSEAEDAAKEMGIELEATSPNTFQGKKEDPNGYNKLTVWLHMDQLPAKIEKAAPERTSMDEPVDLVILFEPQKGLGDVSIVNALTQIEDSVLPFRTSIKGSLAMRGIPVRPDSAERIAISAQAKQQEAYNDGHTSSNTYFSPKLISQLKSGKHTVNLQIAEAASLGGNPAELIVGIPLITGDYVVPN